MKTSRIIFALLMSLLTISITLNAQEKTYKKAGTIQVIDKKIDMSGTEVKDGDIITLSLLDINKYNGHTCGCGVAGFLITKKVFEMFYPNDVPNRRTMKVSISEYNMDLIDAITFITGNRLNRGEYTNSESDFIINPELAGEQGTTTILFERKDNGQKIKVVINRKVLLTPDEMNVVMTLKPKMQNGTATPEEKQKYAITTQAIVKKEITNLPEGAFTYTLLN